MVTKISEAAMIAKLGIDVYIVKVRLDFEIYFNTVNAGVLIVTWMQAATEHSLRALQGVLRENIPDDWLGTIIRYAR